MRPSREAFDLAAALAEQGRAGAELGVDGSVVVHQPSDVGEA